MSSALLPPRRRTAYAVTAALLGSTLAAGPSSASPAPGGREPAGPPPAQRLVPGSDGVSALEVPLPGTEPVVTAQPFSMVALTWHADGREREVQVRTRDAGRWSPWQELPELADGPDRGTSEGGARTGTDLAWTGPADAVRVRVEGAAPGDARLVLLDAAHTPVPAARAQQPAAAAKVRPRPRLLGRQAWGADPAWRTGRPTYNRTIQQVHVHHTVNSNDYAAADVPGLLRGMYRYHTQSLGWSDIGYNFLVDRFGRTWVGRAGGAKKAVRGAHTLGFNSTSTGVAVIGSFESRGPGRKAVTALVQLAAWKLHRHGRKPRARVYVYSHGSDRYPAGRTVRLPAIDGHRDTNETACPGERLYAKLPAIRKRAAQRARRF